MTEFDSIHHALKCWGRWRARHYTEAVRSLRPSTPPEYGDVERTCQTCHANKTVRVITGDGHKTVKCPNCKGKGTYMERTLLVDPETIPGPSVMRVRADVPEAYTLIDDALEGLSWETRAVVLARYVYAPRGHDHDRLYEANRILAGNDQKRISREMFWMTLKDCQVRLAEITGLDINKVGD